jgi:hypothetical protein
VSRADKFLEGFKLGSLGVSRKPKVTFGSDEPAHKLEHEPITVLKEGKNKLDPVRDVSGPYFFWSEDDGTRYGLRMAKASDTPTYELRLAAGKLMEIRTTSTLLPGSCYPTQAAWDGAFKPSAKGLATIISKFHDFVAIIKIHSILGLIENGSMDSFFPFKGEPIYATWLKEKKEQAKS